MYTNGSVFKRVRLVAVSVVSLLAMFGVFWPQAASAATNVTATQATYAPANHAGSAYFITKPKHKRAYVKPKRTFVQPKRIHKPKKHFVQPKKVQPKKAQHCKVVHKVKKHDTLSSIAARYHTNTRTLAKANKLHNPDLIKKGQRLCVR